MKYRAKQSAWDASCWIIQKRSLLGLWRFQGRVYNRQEALNTLERLERPILLYPALPQEDRKKLTCGKGDQGAL